MTPFNEMDLPSPIANALKKMHFNEPTPIQAQAIPLALEGRDIMGSAQTGTGKTAAFGIPLAAKLLNNDHSTALVMTPTRELAKQVMMQIKELLSEVKEIKVSLLIGGECIKRQLRELKKKPRVIVGTPGRIYDHLRQKSLSLSQADFLVLDETDRMLDMGFTIQIENILAFLPKKRQTLLFSATLPKTIVHMAKKYMHEPEHIAVTSESKVADNLDQSTVQMKQKDKYSNLLDALNEREGSIIVFVKTKYGTEEMVSSLSQDGFQAKAFHGDLRQNKRDRIIKGFRNQKYRILIATDVAARGLDIPHIEHVINYDLPHCAEDYVHRIGRTARAGAKGSALNFVSPSDTKYWNAIDRMLNPGSHDSSQSHEKKSRPRSFGNKNAHPKRKSGFSLKRKKFSGQQFGKKRRANSSNSNRKPKRTY